MMDQVSRTLLLAHHLTTVIHPETLELSFNSMRLFVGSWSVRTFHWLFCININNFFPLVVHVSEVVLYILTKSNLFESMRTEVILAPICIQMEFTLNEPEENDFCLKLHTTSKYPPQTYSARKMLYPRQPTPDQKSR